MVSIKEVGRRWWEANNPDFNLKDKIEILCNGKVLPPRTAAEKKKYLKGRVRDKDVFDRIADSLAGTIVLGWFPEGLLFHPRGLDPHDDETLEAPPASGFETLHLTGPKREHYTAFYHEAKPGFPTIAYCHGNSGSLLLSQRFEVLKTIANEGFGIMIVAYPGFRGSERDWNGKKQDVSVDGCLRATRAMLRALDIKLEQNKVPNRHVILFGESIGGGVAFQTAYSIQRGFHNPPLRKPSALITLGTFSSLEDRIKDEYKRISTNRIHHIFPSKKYASELDIEGLILHGTEDEIIGYSHAETLKRYGGHRFTLCPIPGGTHRLTKEGTDTPDPAQLRFVIEHIHDFLAERGLCPPRQSDRAPGGSDLPPGSGDAASSPEANGTHQERIAMNGHTAANGWHR